MQYSMSWRQYIICVKAVQSSIGTQRFSILFLELFSYWCKTIHKSAISISWGIWSKTNMSQIIDVPFVRVRSSNRHLSTFGLTMKRYSTGIFCILVSLNVILVNGQCGSATPERHEVEEPLPPMWNIRPEFSCISPNIDTAVMTMDKKTFFFKGDYYWKLNDADVAPGYPRLISQDWGELPGHLDASFTWNDGRTFFFKDTQYWSFHNKVMDPGYPKLISDGFCGIPDRLDAAVLWASNRKVYFFKGDKYWRFDGGEEVQPVKSDYPMGMSEWRNIPNNVDAAIQWENGRTYFLKGTNYYRFDDYGNDHEAGRPVPIHGKWGLNCTMLRSLIPPPIVENDNEFDNLV